MGHTDLADGKLADVLWEYAVAKFSGVLRVDGQPGGVIHLADGRICACETPGAPSLEVILLRSRRVAESDWDAAFAAAAVGGRQLTAELVARKLLGAGEVEALLRIALADAMFALASGQVNGWSEEPPADCPLPLAPAAKSGWLLAEATRRVRVLASFPEPVPRAQDRIAAGPGTARASRVPGQGQDEILALVDGRRTARDLAFALGRGLYETLLQLARMRADHLVVVNPSGTQSPSPASVTTDGTEDDHTASGLPRRRKDRPVPPRPVEPADRNIADVSLLRRRSGGTATPGVA